MTAILLLAMAAGQLGTHEAVATGNSVAFHGSLCRAWRPAATPVVSGSIDGVTAGCERCGVMVFTGDGQGTAGFSGKLMAMWKEGRYMWSINNGGRSGRIAIAPSVGDSLQVEITATSAIFTVNGTSFSAPGAFDVTSEPRIGVEGVRRLVKNPQPPIFASMELD